MSTFRLGPVSSVIELDPDYDYTFELTKVQTDHRTRSGKLFSYKFATYRRFEVPESWVNSSQRTLVNSWWETNTELAFFDDYDTYPQSYWNVRIMNDKEPYPEFIKPYFKQFYSGELILETY
jgi:hypothetical protein